MIMKIKMTMVSIITEMTRKQVNNLMSTMMMILTLS